ncbi:MAG: CPBP family intramembrane metalloprotease [Methanobrevibacter sp.]|uniref:CPBP family intramembrane glutamic endopeptidase n=1 Tax=Methanobrevibacter sp. TaxID=66852 RepID=UPI001B59AEFF|nr:CPBP family glutamic-type intramembrane protease [Methanobrevibacter sp.]MBP3791741.1 CPBP family intramembrane metalloprotease [Methanobrevibacter sp.]
MTGKEISEYTTFPRTFEKYRWYKPILVFIIGAIIFLILSLILTAVFSAIYGDNIMYQLMHGGYEIMNTEIGEIYSHLGVAIMIPSLYLATRIVKDRPFSSYSSSRGGWNRNLYLKAFIIPFILFLIVGVIEAAILGNTGDYHFSILFFIILLIVVPLQCIAEEYVFRGLIMQTFGSWFNIPILAVILQAITFGLTHGYNGIGNIGIIISGLVMGFLAWKSNGLEVSSAFHTANNLSLSLLVMFGIQSTTSTIQMSDLIISTTGTVIFGILLYYIGKRSNWFGEIPENLQEDDS